MSRKTDYAEIDATILACIKAGKPPHYNRAVESAAKKISSATGREEMRAIDGRLKCLRNAGKIVYQYGKGAGWRMTP